LAGANSDEYASSDTLTGLGGKESFSREFTRCIVDKASEHSVFSLIIIDIDHFKSVNDGFGHRRGDQILAEFGKRVLEVSREKDMVFRYGAMSLQDSPLLSITLSIGIVQFPVDGSSVRELFDSAGRRLYTAKRSGWNRVVSADDPDQSENGDNIRGRMLGREKGLLLL
jgi:GGDEF domain-containing protein